MLGSWHQTILCCRYEVVEQWPEGTHLMRCEMYCKVFKMLYDCLNFAGHENEYILSQLRRSHGWKCLEQLNSILGQDAPLVIL